jgi:CBS domain-containing protein
MLKKIDLAVRSLLTVAGLNSVSVAAGRFDLIAWASRSRRGPNLAARTIEGVFGGAALYSLARLIEQRAFAKRPIAGGRVREVMTTTPRSITPGTPVVEAARLLAQQNVGSVPVVEHDRLVGILTDRDIALRVVAEGRNPGDVAAGDIASGELATVEPEESLEEALRVMSRRQVRRLPVVEHGRLVGILAQADVARQAPEAETGEVVEQISR